MSASGKKRIELEVGGRTVSVSSPDKLYFPHAGISKLDLVQYYLVVAEGVLRGAGGRPNVMKRFVQGIAGDFFFQKRAPAKRPPWLRTVVLSFPSGRSAEEIVPDHPAALAWMVNLGCIDLNPHAIRSDDLEHPDELRVDLDPTPGVEWKQLVDVAMVVRETLPDFGLVGWPKTSGSRGIHINVRIERKWDFSQVRRAAMALAREVARRAPQIATSFWRKEERHGVFLDYNQNAKDRTVASAYSVRPNARAQVSTPLTWVELATCDPEAFTMHRVLERYRERGDPHRDIDLHPGTIESLLQLYDEQEAQGAKPPRSNHPLLVIAHARTEAEAREGLHRWRARHPQAARHLKPEDVLVDAMRGRYTTWTRIRLNLRHIPPELRPPQEPPDPDYNPWRKTDP